MDELEIIRHPQIEGLSLFFDTIDYRTPHVHSEWELLWLTEQDLSVTWGQTQCVLHPGQMILLSPHQPHELHRIGAEATFLCLQLSPSLLPFLPSVTLETPLVHLWFSEGEMVRLRHSLTCLEQAYLEQAEQYELWCTGQSLLLLHQLLRRMHCHRLTPAESAAIAQRSARLRRLIAFVDDNYMHKIRLTDFAEAEGVSLSYLSRFIKNTMNQSFQDYVASVRFQAARRLIASGKLNMLEVCMESGFSDYRYFSRMFRSQYGMTPEAFSRCSSSPFPVGTVPHSLHSVERFYTPEESRLLLNKFKA